MGLLGSLSIFLISHAGTLVAFFSTEDAVVSAGVDCLRMISYGFIFYALGMVMIQAFNGAGDTATPTWMNFFCFWMLEIPLAWILSILAGMEEKGVYLAIIIAESTLALVAMLMFRRGKWKLREV